MFFSSLFPLYFLPSYQPDNPFIELTHPLVFGMHSCPPPTLWTPPLWLNPQVKSNIHQSWDGVEVEGGPVSCSTYLFLFCFLLFCQSHLYPMTASVMLFIPTFLSRQSARALHILMFFTAHVCVRKAERPKRMSRSRPQNERGENVNNICDCASEAVAPPPLSECVHTVTFHPWLWTLSYDPVVAVVVVIAETSYGLLYPECSGPLHKCSEAKDNRD